MLNAVKKIEKALGVFSRIFACVSALALICNALIIGADVFSRFVLKHALIGSSEYVSVLETILIFFALAYTLHSKGLVHIAFFMKKLPGELPAYVWTFNEWCGALVAVLLTYAAYLQSGVVQKLHMATTARLIPYYPFYVFMTVGLGAYALVQIFGAVKSTIGLFDLAVRQDVKDSWPV
ncbi:MAG: TRAP transporter small permease [Clostridiales Family XIII bacterium]|jgi:TRAP-type C4-dicarboxylate transport system permease small subunit|nr:TRAP transporter small permease [Clostridiales Family XIII bacterium]